MASERRCPEGFEPCAAWVHHGVCNGGYHRQEPDDERLNWTPSDPTSAINAALLLIQKQSVQMHRIADHTATMAAALERLAFPSTYIIGPEGADRLRGGSVNLLLDAPTYQRVDGYVWCDQHGCVHEASGDPYSDGGDCRREHRPVFTTPDAEIETGSALFDHLDGCMFTTDTGWQCRPACPSREEAR